MDHDRRLKEVFDRWDEDGSQFLTKAKMRPLVRSMLNDGFQLISPRR